MSTKTSAGEKTGKGASPIAAAGYLAAIVYIWLEAILRIILTNTMLLANFMLWNYRVGDIAAMWLTMSVVAVIVFVLAAYGFRSRTNVGSITFWTTLLVISIIIAPLLGELGTPIGI